MLKQAETEEIRKSRYWEIAAILACTVFPFLGASIAGLMQPIDYSLPSTLTSLIMSGIGVTVIAAFIIHRSAWKAEDHGVDQFKAKHIPWGIFLYIVVLATFFVCSTIYQMLFRSTNPHYFAEGAPWQSHPLAIAPLIVIAFIINSIAEEVALRGILQTHLTAICRSEILGIICVNILFASYHVYQGFQALLPIFILGMILSFGRILFKSIWPSVIAHTIYNLVILIPFIRFY